MYELWAGCPNLGHASLAIGTVDTWTSIEFQRSHTRDPNIHLNELVWLKIRSTQKSISGSIRDHVGIQILNKGTWIRIRSFGSKIFKYDHWSVSIYSQMSSIEALALSFTLLDLDIDPDPYDFYIWIQLFREGLGSGSAVLRSTNFCVCLRLRENEGIFPI